MNSKISRALDLHEQTQYIQNEEYATLTAVLAMFRLFSLFIIVNFGCLLGVCEFFLITASFCYGIFNPFWPKFRFRTASARPNDAPKLLKLPSKFGNNAVYLIWCFNHFGSPWNLEIYSWAWDGIRNLESPGETVESWMIYLPIQLKQ